jgi:hypothetical protein
MAWTSSRSSPHSAAALCRDLVWLERQPDRVFVQRFDTQGQPAGTPVQLEVLGVSSGEGSNRSLGPRRRSLLWFPEEKIGNDPHAFVQRFDASGNKVGEALTLDVPGNPGAYGFRTQDCRLGQDGAFAVTWTGSSAADGLCVYVQSFTRAGTPTGNHDNRRHRCGSKV